MARCKMDQPERAAYLRVFCAVLLTDEDWETLDRAKFGSACLLMFHAWAKQGSLPSDPEKLASLARCTVEELEALRRAWPKLVPLEDLDQTAEPGARVTIPYLWREWQQVMGFYAAQKERSGKGVAARKAKGSPQAPPTPPQGQPMGEPMGQPLGIPNQAQDQAKEKENPPTPLKGVRGRRSAGSGGGIMEFPQEVLDLARDIGRIWRREQPDGSKINPDGPLLRERLDQILRQTPGVTREVLFKAAELYLGQAKKSYKAPQFFFGPGTTEDPKPWLAYARQAHALLHPKPPAQPQPPTPEPLPLETQP